MEPVTFRQAWAANYSRFKIDSEAAAMCRTIYRLIRSAAFLDLATLVPFNARIDNQLRKIGIPAAEFRDYVGWMQEHAGKANDDRKPTRAAVVGLFREVEGSFARLKAVRAKVDAHRQRFKNAQAADGLLLKLCAEYNSIEKEWDDAFRKFRRLSAEAARMIERHVGIIQNAISTHAIVNDESEMNESHDSLSAARKSSTR